MIVSICEGEKAFEKETNLPSVHSLLPDAKLASKQSLQQSRPAQIKVERIRRYQ